MPEHVDLGVAVAVGAAVGIGGYLLAGPLLAVHLGFVYAVLTWLFANYRDAVPETEHWRTGRWTGLLTAVAILGGSGAMYAGTADPGTGFAVAGLVYGVGYTGFLVAVAMISDEQSERSPPTDAGPNPNR